MGDIPVRYVQYKVQIKLSDVMKHMFIYHGCFNLRLELNQTNSSIKSFLDYKFTLWNEHQSKGEFGPMVFNAVDKETLELDHTVDNKKVSTHPYFLSTKEDIASTLETLKIPYEFVELPAEIVVR